MAKILSIETSTQICSVCISEGNNIKNIQSFSEHFSHTEIITELIQKCSQESGVPLADLDAVALSQGPGSYTALRVGTSTAKGLCYGLDIPLITIDTLRSLALASQKQEKTLGTALYVPSIDARRMEIFTSFWHTEGQCIKPMHALILEKNSFDEFSDYDHIVFSGDCNDKIKNLYVGSKYVYSDIIPSSAHLVPIALKKFIENDFASVANFTPVYAKAPNITTPKKVL